MTTGAIRAEASSEQISTVAVKECGGSGHFNAGMERARGPATCRSEWGIVETTDPTNGRTTNQTLENKEREWAASAEQ